MAQSKTRQRGVASTATSAILAALGIMLGIAGCSSDESSGTGGSEHLDVSQQGIICKSGVCNTDDCTTFKCNAIGACEFVSKQADGEACVTNAGIKGICTTNPGDINPKCCTNGCIRVLKLGGYECHPGNTINNCGPIGEKCVDCDNGNSCEFYGCDPDKHFCTVEPIPDGKPCTDGNGACLKGSCCAGCIDGNDVCQPGNTVANCGLSSIPDTLVKCKSCDDGNVCNNDSCQNGICAAPTPKAGACPDATVCNGAEMCGNGTCNAGTPLNCNDQNPCTVDSCDAVTGCVHTPKEAGVSCDDATVCNGVSKCELDLQGKIFCKAGTAPDCDDNNICTTDSCDPAAGCKHVNNTLDCSDNDLCTLVDKCAAGKCVGTGAPNCDDNEACTDDSCDPGRGCQHANKQDNVGCDDENGCTTGDKCTAGKCAGIGQSCDDDKQCTKNSCTVQNGCSNPNETDGTPCTFDRCHQNSSCKTGVCDAGAPIDCDDGNPCTDDGCDAATGCTHANIAGDCSDADLCTTADTCKGGECVGTAVTCTPLDDCHVAGVCNAKTGVCDDPRADDQTECDDGNGTCLTGKCVPLPGAGGAGGMGAGGVGEPGGAGEGTGTGGTVTPQGGDSGMPIGGEGNEPGAGGVPGEPGKGGTSTNGGTDGPNEGGEAGIDPERVFVRNPGGCACNVPTSRSSNALWLAALALGAAVARRRRQAPGQRF
jgi:MYXO-CTERM domain-containing protein